MAGHEIYVPRETYLEILGFACYTYLNDKIAKFSGIGGGLTRTLGQYIENFINGKIAEEALRLFLCEKFGLETLTEVGIADFYLGVYNPDIVVIKKQEAWVPVKFWIDVKEVRRDQKWLLIPGSSVRGSKLRRPYDAYVGVWVGLPDDHFIYALQSVPEIKTRMSESLLRRVKGIMKMVGDIPCKVYGFALWDDIQAVVDAHLGDASSTVTRNAKKLLEYKFGSDASFYFDGKSHLFDPDNPSWKGAIVRENVGFLVDGLKQASKWDQFASLVSRNERVIPEVPIPITKAGRPYKRAGLPDDYCGSGDYRDGAQAYLTDQLEEIKERLGSLKRTESWFTEKF